MGASRKQSGNLVVAPSRAVRFDPLRCFVFPNNLRTLRKEGGFPKLLQLAQQVPEIPYIRLSKIERGEVFARADELVRLASLLAVRPDALLVDVADESFDLQAWAEPFLDGEPVNNEAEAFAVLLGAALHMRRATDRSLTIALLNAEYNLPPVIVSRIENAAKTVDRWNDHVLDGLNRIFGARSLTGLRRTVESLFAGGALDPYLDRVSNPELRREKSRARVAELRAQLAEEPEHRIAFPSPLPPAADATILVGLLPVLGVPLPDGLIAPLPTAERVPAPPRAGPRAYALRIGRPTLGGGLPGNAIVIVDPDRFPSSGGLAIISEGANRRLLMVTVDRHGAMKGYSENPDREVSIDSLDPVDVAAVIGAIFD